MSKELLNISNLEVSTDNKNIIKGLSLNINYGEIHIIMGPNGTGKSSLVSAIMGNPLYKITGGSIKYKDKNLLEMEVDERSRDGIFLAMQYPSELPGISNFQFLKAIYNLKNQNMSNKLINFYNEVEESREKLNIDEEFMDRSVNVGFSGGEKKKNEILQMLLLKPNLIILDEIDSGLDVDALKEIGENITEYFKNNKESVSILIITHYSRILKYIKPDFVHVIKSGKIVKSGNQDLIEEIDSLGYEGIK